jgi:hypothetical protein
MTKDLVFSRIGASEPRDGCKGEAGRGVALGLVLCLSVALPQCLGAAPFQDDAPGTTAKGDLKEADAAIDGLWEITADLNTAVRNFHRHLDEATVKYDGSPTSADAELRGGDGGIAQDAIRKSMAARGLAAAESDAGYQPRFLQDLKDLENLILAARQRIDDTDAINRRLLLVSSGDLKTGEAGKKDSKQNQLKKAREAARSAATKALQTLPVPLAEDNSLKEPAMEVVLTGIGRPRSDHQGATQKDQTQSVDIASFPLHAQPGKRLTLVNELGRRIALTDLGNVQNQRLFYQEQWTQRGQVVLLKGQLVAVDGPTSQHILVKRYPAREFAASLNEVYGRREYYETRFAKPPVNQPPPEEVESALANVAGLPGELVMARQKYSSAILTSMTRSDRRHTDKGEGPLDAQLPDEARASLYAIRGHLLRAHSILTPESQLRLETSKAEKGIEQLKKLAGWANRPAPAADASDAIAEEWNQLQTKADDSIFTARRAIAEALSILPPDLSAHLAEFPELVRDGVVHMVGVRTSTKTVPALWQEVWNWDAPNSRTPRARQDIQVIVSDPETGDQICVGRQTKYYPVDRGESIVQVYDRIGGPIAPPGEVYLPPELFRLSTSKEPL